MTKMKHIYKYALAAGLFASVMSCTNLEEDLQDRYTAPFDPSNQGVGIKDNVNKAAPGDGLQGAFAKLRDGSATNGGFFAVQETGTDEAVITQKGGDWYDGGLYIRMHHHDFSPQTWAINDAWNHAYGGILQCNDIAEKTKDLNAGQKAQLRALRAYFYWRLLDIFGNVPIVTTAGGSADQSTRTEVYNFVVSELLAARTDLPSVKQEYGRLNQAGVDALLARIYLNAQVYTGTPHYQDAIDAADRVITSGLYSLSPEYSQVFDPKNVENVEHIFVVPFDEATGEGAVWPMMTLHYPSQLTYKLQEQPWNGYSTLEDFYNSYDDNDVRKKANFIVGPQYDLAGNQLLDLAYDKGDPDGAGLVYTPYVNMLEPNASRQGGARFGKFSFKIGQRSNADNDMPLLRYGEVLLNKAEAMMRMSNFQNAAAVDLVNKIRGRASATLFVPSEFTEGKMLAERGRELFVEAHRRTDLIRFDAYHLAWWEKDVDPKKEAHKLMAIPQEQMVNSSSTAHPLKQNPGY